MPAELQARIAAIEARFTASGSTSTSSPANAEAVARFGSALTAMSALSDGSDSLDGLGTGLDALGVLGSQTGLGTLGGASTADPLAAALASRGAALGYDSIAGTSAASGFSGISSASGISGLSGVSGLAGSHGLRGPLAADAPGGGRIASKAIVEQIERTLSNGRLRDDQLAPIGIGSHKLHPEAANAFRQLMAAARAEGIDIGVTDSYRSYEAQVDVARRKGLYSQGGWAAKPGTSSHGFGLAVDLKLDATAQSWMRRNAGRFGFVENTPREPWHWKFDGV